MRITLATSFIFVASALAGFAIDELDQGKSQLKIYPKDLARQHVGSNLFLFDPTNRTYQPTEAAAAWLDSDITTGWPIMAGQQHYLLSLAEPMLLTNFAVSTKPAAGTVTLYAGDEPAVPGAKSWSILARNISLDAINEKKLANPFNRFAKYVLIETDVADPGPLFSVYLYGDRPAVSYQLHKREKPIDTTAIFGRYVNAATAYDLAALCTQAQITYANASGGFLSWQKVIDENPESGISLLPSNDVAGLVIKLGASRNVSRFAILTDGAAKGSIDFYLLPEVPSTPVAAVAASDAEVAKGAQPGSAISEASGPSVAGLTPTTTVVLDGTTPRSSVDDFPVVEGGALLVRWTPSTAGEALALRELNAFGDVPLDGYELALSSEAIAELGNGGQGLDGKDYKGGKGLLPVGEFITPRMPPVPGALGFPPNITRRNPVSP